MDNPYSCQNNSRFKLGMISKNPQEISVKNLHKYDKALLIKKFDDKIGMLLNRRSASTVEVPVIKK